MRQRRFLILYIHLLLSQISHFPPHPNLVRLSRFGSPLQGCLSVCRPPWCIAAHTDLQSLNTSMLTAPPNSLTACLHPSRDLAAHDASLMLHPSVSKLLMQELTYTSFPSFLLQVNSWSGLSASMLPHSYRPVKIKCWLSHVGVVVCWDFFAPSTASTIVKKKPEFVQCGSFSGWYSPL